MQVNSTPSFDSFIASRASSQAPRGNGDNESFARLMQQRQEQDSPKPAPRAPVAAAPAPTPGHEFTQRPTVARSEGSAPTQRPAPGSSDARTTQAAADSRQAASRKAEGSKLDKRGKADGDTATPQAGEASGTDPVANQDADPALAATNAATNAATTSTTDLFAQFPGLAPKQPPIEETAEPAEAANGVADAAPVLPPSRTAIAAADVGTIAFPGKDLVPGPKPFNPREAVAGKSTQDQSPVSLAPVADTGARFEKPGLVPGGNDVPALLQQQQQQAAMLVEQPAKTEKVASTEPVVNLDAVGATAAAGAVGPSTRHVGETPTLQIPTPVHSPEFKEALGVQVSILAKDGVQHAELHLNPADMGPISIQISTEGTHARVDFGADSAATRQILEAGLPELASALQSAGMTLTGGGVSQHSQGGSQGQDDSRGSRGARRVTMGGEAASALGAPVASRAPRGALDLYA